MVIMPIGADEVETGDLAAAHLPYCPVPAGALVSEQTSLSKSERLTHQCGSDRGLPGYRPTTRSASSRGWPNGSCAARGAVIISRLDELPPDASRDRQSFQEFSIN